MTKRSHVNLGVHRGDDVERCVLAFRALCPEADAVGVTLCYEGTLAAADVKDALVRRGDCAPGRGRVDFQESAQALEEIGYDGWVVLETPAGPPDVVARDFSFAREVFPALARTP